jgi:hypothetical protein
MIDGHMNSKFFHIATTSGKQINKITKLISDFKIEVNIQEGLCTLDVDYFLALFKTTTCEADLFFKLCIHACISEDRAVFDFLEVCEIIKVDL